jgi:hypothetical protein
MQIDAEQKLRTQMEANNNSNRGFN